MDARHCICGGGQRTTSMRRSHLLIASVVTGDILAFRTAVRRRRVPATHEELTAGIKMSRAQCNEAIQALMATARVD